ncbi:hypothetical protein FE634_01615 [Nocardioides dongxiaopingii]|uniref:hypothetical protein n=1 Tax=Nocardioides TaxID=1839 RepID=UPI0010C7706C|nr:MULTISPECIES: hypothetical protein [Nocardioides]QCW49435.1 hypothetical protein FE634_01615 [Nocardioides sp. S-1144]
MSDPQRDVRARRRALAKEHHPDVGGDPAEFVRAMRGLGGSAGDDGPDAVTSGTTTVAPSRVARSARRVRGAGTTLVATVRRRLPRSFPGSRRYGHL